MTRTAPNPEQLLDCARRLAVELHEVTPPQAELADRIEHVLWGRKRAWALLDEGVLSEVEVRDLLIAHLDYECADLSGRSWTEFDRGAREQLVADFDRVLFGEAAHG